MLAELCAIAAFAPSIRADRRAPGSKLCATPSSKSVNRLSGPLRLPTAASSRGFAWKRTDAPSKPPARLLQRQPRADDLRRLFARARQDLGERHDPALRAGDAGVKTHDRAHRDGSRTHAHANSFCRPCRPDYNEIEREGLREAGLRDVQDVARIALSGRGNQWMTSATGTSTRTRDRQDHRLSGLRAAAACDAGGRACTVLAPGLLVARAGLRHDQRRDAGGAECQQRDDDCEGEPPHRSSVTPGHSWRIANPVE